MEEEEEEEEEDKEEEACKCQPQGKAAPFFASCQTHTCIIKDTPVSLVSYI